MDSKRASHFTGGLIVLAIGLFLLAGNLDWSWNAGRLWPMVFVIIGIGKLVSGGAENRGSGLWFLFLAGIFFLHTFRIFTLQHSWPLFIVMAGLGMIFGRDRCRSKEPKVQP